MHLSYPGASTLRFHILSSLGLTIGRGCSLQASRRQVFFSLLSAHRAHAGGLQSLITVAFSFTDMARNTPFLTLTSAHSPCCPKPNGGACPLSHYSCTHVSLRPHTHPSVRVSPTVHTPPSASTHRHLSMSSGLCTPPSVSIHTHKQLSVFHLLYTHAHLHTHTYQCVQSCTYTSIFSDTHTHTPVPPSRPQNFLDSGYMGPRGRTWQ